MIFPKNRRTFPHGIVILIIITLLYAMKTGKIFILHFYLLCAAWILSGGEASGQDYIIRTNGDSIRSNVVDVGTEKIRFRRYGMKNGPVLEIFKNQVREIVFENGTRLTIITDAYAIDPDRIIHERPHSIKVDFIAPLLNNVTLCYEMRIKQGRNLEVKAGYIGLDVSSALTHSEGGLGKVGLKFVWLTESILKGQKYANPLRGSYIKPELLFSRYTSREEGHLVNYTNLGIDIVFGRQYTLGQSVTVDYFAGIGYGYQYSSYKKISAYDRKGVDYSFAYSHLFFGTRLPLILSAGMTFGITY